MPICTACITGYEATGGTCEREGRIYVSIISQRNFVAYRLLLLSPLSSSMQISCVIIFGVVLVSLHKDKKNIVCLHFFLHHFADTIVIISVISAVIVVLAVGIIVICAVVFSIRRSKRQSVLRHDYDYPIVMLQRQQRTQDQQQVHIDGNLRQESSFNVYNATLATTEGEVAESNSH